MEYKDYYKILGIERTAAADDIKRAYRKLARQFHPDRNKAKNAEEKFKEINEANEVLSDLKKRRAYDQLGANWRGGQSFTPPQGWNFDIGQGASGGFRRPGGAYASPGFGGGDPAQGGFSDFFSTLFGGAGFENGAGEHFGDGGGQDQRAKISITLEDSYRGATLAVNIGMRNLSVRIPKGVIAGQTIRLAGQSAGGGDLLLEVEFAPHAKFRIEGRDVHVNVPVAPWEAALGAKIPVPTLGGSVEFTLPAGVTAGRKLRLKGRGLPGAQPGDEIVTIALATPPAESDDERAFYRDMEQRFDGFDPRA